MQLRWLPKQFETEDPAAIRHRADGLSSSNRINPAVRQFPVLLIRECYVDLSPNFATEKLAEAHGLKGSRATQRILAPGLFVCPSHYDGSQHETVKFEKQSRMFKKKRLLNA